MFEVENIPFLFISSLVEFDFSSLYNPMVIPVVEFLKARYMSHLYILAVRGPLSYDQRNENRHGLTRG